MDYTQDSLHHTYTMDYTHDSLHHTYTMDYTHDSLHQILACLIADKLFAPTTLLHVYMYNS